MEGLRPMRLRMGKVEAGEMRKRRTRTKKAVELN